VSYHVGAPIMVGSTEVIKGTSTLDDVLSWPSILGSHPTGRLWSQSAQLSRNRQPTAYVGHSWGATIASHLAAEGGKPYHGYGRPGFGQALRGDVMNIDPVTVLLRGERRGTLGHSLSSYG